MAIAATLWRQPESDLSAHQELRLFRNDPRVRFSGIVHESVWRDVRALEREGWIVAESELRMRHLGREPGEPSRFARDIPLLQRAIIAEPGDLYCRKELALALHGVGRAAESIQAAREAVAFARAGGGAISPGQAACAFHTLGVVLGEEGAEAVSVLTEGLLRYPENHSMRYSLANALIKPNVSTKRSALTKPCWRSRRNNGPTAISPTICGSSANTRGVSAPPRYGASAARPKPRRPSIARRR